MIGIYHNMLIAFLVQLWKDSNNSGITGIVSLINGCV